MVVAFAFTFISTLRFYRAKVSKTPVDQRSALTPTLLISVSFLVGAISSAIGFYSLSTLPGAPTTLPPPSIEKVLPWVEVAEFAAPLFGFALMLAGVSALRRRQLYALPVALLTVSYVLTWLSPKHPMDVPYITLWVATVSLMIVLPILLFGYLWRITKRVTALGMFVGLLLYFVYYLYFTLTLSEYVGYLGFYLVPAEYLGHLELYQLMAGMMFIALFVGATSMSFIYWSFRYSDKKLGGEVIGYTMTIPVIATEAFILMLTLGLVPPEYMVTLIMTAVGAGVFILTGSYLYGRYRESHYRQTLALSLFSYFAGIGYLLFNIGQHLYIFFGRFAWFDLISLPVGMLTGSFLFISGVYALERPSLVPAPFMVAVPLIILSLLLYPMPVWLLYTMVVVAVALTIVPGAMFAILLRRMRMGKEKGRGRILGIFTGFLFLLLGSPIQTLSASVPDPMAFVSSPIAIIGSLISFLGALFFYLGVSGRFDRWFYERRH
jgi:hypothetical protein